MPPLAPARPILISEFPVPCAVFTASLRGTESEIWSHLLALRHGREKHTPEAWQALLGNLTREAV